ncbi:MAG: metal ABC transporter substrate-binding protein [Clostridia bacterium]|nr:metal ABC transporter substrate-binding protein [Clostridia bacterium]
MKKIICLLLSALLTVGMFCGCGSKESGKLKIVTTIFPCYDWTREILGERADDVELTFLLNNGVDLHSFQPTSADLVKITGSDLFIYIGGESDEWVEDVINTNKSKNINTLNTMDVLKNNILEEETVEGMQEEHDAEEAEELEYDEHIWLSFDKASAICDEICKKLSKIDKQNSSIYEENTKKFKQKLSDISQKYKETVNSAQTKTLLFADRFPFRYLTEDLGIKYYAAFSGCSSESDATFKTITFLADKLKEEKLSSVIVLEGNNKKIAETVIKTSKLKNIKILELNSMQTATVKKGKTNDTYLSIAENNLKILKEALNK